LTFNNNNEGSTFIDIDEDGDLDLYVNKNGSANELWINNLGAAKANHLYIDILEDRDAFGLINLETRFGNGATATILDCAGNVISGIREVNGGYGHGTQEPGVIHFGLPGGPNTAIVLEVAYPRHGSGSNDRVVVREELTPSDPAFSRGNIHIITVLPTSGNQAPIANDDVISTTENIAVTFDPLVDNDNGVDSDPDGDPFSVISITQPANGTAVLNGDGTITYTPDAGFFGSDPFTYTIEDSTSCTLVNIQSVGNIIMTVNRDNDDDGIADIADFDDDNDGILDTDEGCGNVIVNGSFEQQDFSNATTFPGGFTDVWGTYIGSSFNSNVLTGWNYTTNLDGWVGNQSPNWSTNTFAPAYHGIQYIDLIGSNVHSGGTNNILTQVVNTTPGLTYSLSFYWGEYANHIAGVVQYLDVDVIDSGNNTIVNETLTTTSVGVQSGFMGPNNWIYSERTFVATTAQTTVQFTTLLSPTGASGPSLDFVNVSLASTTDCVDTDNDGVPNAFDLDSDNDGILDAEEAGHGIAHTNGVIVGSVGTDGIPDSVQASPNDENTNYTIAESTDDSDSIPNYLDLDADGDGIPDNVEAQTTTGYNPPSGTVDANGVFTNYTSGLNPTNTDGTDNPDYLDTDSDNEGGTDTTEAGITLAGVDTDNDGLDDNIDTTADYSDPGGTIDHPLNAPVILTDADNDASTGGDVDFRDALDDRPDNDSDGIADVDDIDDDNDGILDTDEGCGNLVINGNFEAQDFTDGAIFPNGFTSVIGTFIGSTYNANTLYGWDYTQNIDGWVGGAPLGANTFADAYSRIQYLDIIGNNSASSPIGENNVLSQTIPTIVGQSYTLSFYWGEDIGHRVGAPVEMDVRVRDAVTTTIIQSQNLTTTATGIVGGVVGPKNWFAYSQVFTATSVQTTIEFESTPDGTANGIALDYISVFKNGTCQDTDNDGVIDAFDLDSDNDGILDAVEAGHNQPHTNGVVNGVVGADGLPDAVQDSPNNEQTNYSIAESTDDADAIPNFLDLDSDGDGIPDNVEAQTTTGYNPPSGTVDANGVFTNYTVGLNPVDTDSSLPGPDGIPDYLDTDSDNEGGNDTTEAGITLANADADNDGLDDNTDATANYSDPGGTIDDPLTAPVILPDVDNDATTGGDVDYRDAESDADLSLRKTVNNSSPDQGATITFTLTIRNEGPSSPTNIVVQDVLPADFTFLNASPATGTANFNTVTRVLTWDLNTYVLAATVGSNTITMTYTVRVDICGEFKNHAEITNSSLADPDSTPNNGN